MLLIITACKNMIRNNYTKNVKINVIQIDSLISKQKITPDSLTAISIKHYYGDYIVLILQLDISVIL